METPKSLRQRPARLPTPRLSERKKSLFGIRKSVESNSDPEQENDIMHGISSLKSSKRTKNTNANTKNTKSALQNTPSKTISFLKNNNSSSPEQIFDDGFEKLPESPPSKDSPNTSPLRRSSRLSLKPKNVSPSTKTSTSINVGKENIPRTPPSKAYGDELPTLFTNSMNLNKSKKSEDEEIIDESTDDECKDRFMSAGKKRIQIASGHSSSTKIRKLDNGERLSIPTKCFYSRNKTSPTQKSPPTLSAVRNFRKNISIKPKTEKKLINKGVRHNIKKKPKHKIPPSVKTNIVDILGSIRNEKLRNLLTSKRQEKEQIENVHQIFKSGKNPIEMAKPLTVITSANNGSNIQDEYNKEDNNNNNNTSKRCYMNGLGDISMGFSDIECSTESEEELFIELLDTQDGNEADEEEEVREPTPVTGRKFFKSGCSTTKKEVKITDNIKATVCNGKLLINPTKQRKRKVKLRNTGVNEFSSEQAKVDEILKNLDVSVVVPTMEEEVDQETNPVNENLIPTEPMCPTPSLSNEDFEVYEEMRMTETEEDDEYERFRRRLPWNTNDPQLIEQQNILLDFLITNRICTEENFTIFIGDPDNHKAEAQKIVDQLVVVVEDNPNSYRERLPYNTTDPAEIEQQQNFLEFLIENNICNEENFQIFIADYARRHEEADRIITQIVATTHNISAEDLERELNRLNEQTLPITPPPSVTNMEMEIPDQNDQVRKSLEASPEQLFPIFYPGRCQPIVKPKSTRRHIRTWNGGQGLNQYQIDAGQKQYGARQCKQCGLVYTVHEPEEEKLHKEYHASLFILKFKSWIDEDLVQIYPEWGPDGRIIRITDNSHVKRQERLKEVLKLVDKELGFSSYILPTKFVAYFAIRQMQIVGVCLVQPLTRAHKYISVNEVDCCTEDSYEAKCGISRIWVSPLHRRFHIATKLIRAVQLYTIFGEEIPLDKIAFSAPTEDGKKFAKNITKSESFLVYT